VSTGAQQPHSIAVGDGYLYAAVLPNRILRYFLADRRPIKEFFVTGNQIHSIRFFDNSSQPFDGKYSCKVFMVCHKFCTRPRYLLNRNWIAPFCSVVDPMRPPHFMNIFYGLDLFMQRKPLAPMLFLKYLKDA